MPWNEEGWNKKREGSCIWRSLAFLVSDFVSTSGVESREVCVVGLEEKEREREKWVECSGKPSLPLPLPSLSFLSIPPWLPAPSEPPYRPPPLLLLLAARCSRSRFISRVEREGAALIRHANVQRSALIKAIPAPAPSFYPARERVEHVRDPIVLFDCGLFFSRKGISFLFPLEKERERFLGKRIFGEISSS